MLSKALWKHAGKQTHSRESTDSSKYTYIHIELWYVMMIMELSAQNSDAKTFVTLIVTFNGLQYFPNDLFLLSLKSPSSLWTNLNKKNLIQSWLQYLRSTLFDFLNF